MKIALQHNQSRRDQRGLTLIEILVSSALLLVITLGLTAMFGQTQRAFRTGLRNADVYEGARAALDLMSRDLEQMSKGPSTNFHVREAFVNGAVVPPIDGVLANDRTRLQEFCFLTQISNRWFGIGYRLDSLAMSNKAGVGHLYRFMSNYPSLTEASNLVSDFENPLPERLRHVYDGLVHFRVTPYATNGYSPYDTNGFLNINSFPNPGTYVSTVLPDGPTNYFDFSNCVPGYVMVEMAVLDPQSYQQFQSIPYPQSPPPVAHINYVKNHSYNVHVFRQQVPIRSAQR
jgi:prepilin-type N-terminal cleavage/methylation domain-containing protein